MSDTTARTFDHEGRIARLEQIADDTRRGLDRLDHRLERLDGRIDRLDGRIDRLDGRLDTRFPWLLGVMLAGFGGLLGAMAHGFHWI